MKRDITQQPAGALIYGSWNVGITDGDRVGNRAGSQIVGELSSDGLAIRTKHTFKKRSGLNIDIRTFGTVVEYRHPTLNTWNNLANGFTTGKLFGFADHNVNTDGMDYTYGSNAYEPYFRWTGSIAVLTAALTGVETEVVVDSTLADEIFDSGTAVSSTATTLTIAGGWAANVWNNLYVRITSGAQSGKVSLISATTSTTITFATITGLSGTPTYEIRQAAFNPSGTLRIGTTNVAYTSIDQDNRFAGATTVPVAANSSAVTQAIQTFPSIARGNILLVKETRMFISGVKKSPSSTYYSRIADATDFSFSSPRNADDGGVIDTPEGGGAVTGLGLQEQSVYILKKDIIKTLQFTQDALDLPIIDTLIQAPNVGPITPQSVFYVDNQLYYASAEGGVKAVSRVREINFIQSLQLSDSIVELVRTLDFNNSAGIFFQQRAYISARTPDSTANNIVLVFNYQKATWEAPIIGWNVNSFNIVNGELHWGDSFNSETYKLTPANFNDNGNAYLSRARFAFQHFGEPAMRKKVSNLLVEGLLSQNTTLVVRILYNYKGLTSIIEGEIKGTDGQFLLEDSSLTALGLDPLGVNPLGLVDVEEDELSTLARFRVYFPVQIERFYEISVELESDQPDAQWEVIRKGFDAEIDPSLDSSLKKSLGRT